MCLEDMLQGLALAPVPGERSSLVAIAKLFVIYWLLYGGDLTAERLIKIALRQQLLPLTAPAVCHKLCP